MPTTVTEPRFDFGVNWKAYSEKALSPEDLKAAEASLAELFGEADFAGFSFLDIGCGSGIFSVSAANLGASRVVGFDLSEHSVQASRQNAARYAAKPDVLRFEKGDVLDEGFMKTLGPFDRVYAWGCLHHTGALWRALDRAADTVSPGGKLVLGIYRKHWSSRAWLGVKKLYNRSPGVIRRLLVFIFYPVIFLAKWLLTMKNPLLMRRGMSFYYDVVDWIGGYPYEYASAEEVTERLKAKGFRLAQFWPASLPTGNHEYLFIKNA